jgi:hypothetical protein
MVDQFSQLHQTAGLGKMKTDDSIDKKLTNATRLNARRQKPGHLVLAGGLALLLTGSCLAEEASGGDLSKATQNPISSLISVPFKLTIDQGASNGDAQILNINPVFPVTVGDWNLVSRALIPLANVDGPIPGPDNPSPGSGNGASGLGDINYSLYFSPVKYDKVIWGVGPSINLPTASDDQLGSGKWSAGISAVALTQPEWGTVGILGRQLWSFAGDSDRKNVNQSLIEPFLTYNLDQGWYLTTDLVITSNWKADSGNRWTVPLGGGFGKIFKVGNQPINAKLEAYYNVERPDGAPEWNIAFQWAFLFPK